MLLNRFKSFDCSTECGVFHREFGFIMDEWEVEEDQLLIQEEIGEGAFGKVYKAFLKTIPEPVNKVAPFKSIIKRASSESEKGITVAVKRLHSE